jgi:hypothetical protein
LKALLEIVPFDVAGARRWHAHCVYRSVLWSICSRFPSLILQRKPAVQGKLSEPCVAELCTTWRNASRDLNDRGAVIDLRSLTAISRDGKTLFSTSKDQRNSSSLSIFTGLKRLISERGVNMSDAKQITGSLSYASRDDFRQVFDEDMKSLYLLSYLLTADREKGEQCFVSGLEDAVEGNPVFKEWVRSWARRVIIVNAVRAINPQPTERNGRSSSVPVCSNGKTTPMEQVEITAVLALDPFERFVYVITVLEHYSDQDCCLLLGCARRDVVDARARAFEKIGSAMASHSRQPPAANSEKPASHERRSSLLDLLVGQCLAISA